jgi:cellulose synthase/poly-beta-1,6-N-acetylglucosamine synthase-like glycosyltransferase
MWWPFETFLVLGVLLLGQSAWLLGDGIRFLRLVRRRRSCPPGRYTPSATVVIPCKGVDAGFDANLECFLNQDYPDYQIVFVVSTSTDLAYHYLQKRLDSPVASGVIRKARTSIVVAGLSDERGEKVNNLLRGVAEVDRSAQVLVFADIDAAPSPVWLRSLVAPLAESHTTVSTGYRWYLPGASLASRLRAAWDTSIATMLGEHDRNFAWGGSMAIRAADFHKLNIAQGYWTSTLSDDLAMTRAVREAGGKIAFEPRCLVASREESSPWGFFRWSTRQVILTRIYAAHLWRLGFAVCLFNSATFILGLAVLAMPSTMAYQRVGVASILLAVVLLGAGKGYIRTVVARELFPEELGGRGSCYWLLSPLVSWISLANFVMSAFTRRIEWRGTEYELVSSDKVRVLRRASGRT